MVPWFASLLAFFLAQTLFRGEDGVKTLGPFFTRFVIAVAFVFFMTFMTFALEPADSMPMLFIKTMITVVAYFDIVVVKIIVMRIPNNI